MISHRSASVLVFAEAVGVADPIGAFATLAIDFSQKTFPLRKVESNVRASLDQLK